MDVSSLTFRRWLRKCGFAQKSTQNTYALKERHSKARIELGKKAFKLAV